MGDITSNKPKCLTPLISGETILSRQLKQLSETGIINNIIITTGLYDKEIQEYCYSLNLNLTYNFVKNNLYDSTNYIYSLYLAGNLINSDFIFLHGDLVFDIHVLNMIMNQAESSVTVLKNITPLPRKDFKGVILSGKVVRIGVNFFDNAVALQPLYYLKYNDWQIWFSNIITYCENKNISCYAEDAFNSLNPQFSLYPLDVGEYLCSEIDNTEDLLFVNKLLGNNR